jgi:hypothetical protein
MSDERCLVGIIALKQYRFRAALSTMKNTAVVCQAVRGFTPPKSVLVGIFPQMADIIWNATNGII